MNQLGRASLCFVGLIAALGAGCQGELDADESDSFAQLDPNIDAGIDVLDAGSVDGGVDRDGAVGDAATPVDAARPRPVVPPVTLRPKGAPYIAEVRANGTGCPAGTWDVAIAPDGQTFTLRFFEYFVEIGDGTRVAIRDCNVTVRLSSPSGVSYAVSDFMYQGYAFLEAGVRGFQTANYYMAGNPVPAADTAKRTELSGPVDRSYLFQDTVRAADAVWSPCGLDRNLQIVTRIGLQKSGSKGAGFMFVENAQVFKLVYRRC